jgi:hypothetical protein
LDKGLVGYWTFDGKDIGLSGTRAKDLSGNNNYGTLNGGASLKGIEGKIGQALQFDGINDGVLVTGDVMGTSATTVAAWINTRTLTVDQNIISNDTPAFIAELKIDQGDNQLEFSSDGGSTIAGISLTNLKTNTWMHIVAVRNSSNQVTFYVDGVQKGTPNQASGTPSGGATDTSLGYNSDSGGNYWNGLIDEVRIYNRALSASEIARLYNSTQSKFNSSQTDSLTKGLVGYWTFDGKDIGLSGTRAKDLSGNNNHGTLTNGPARIEGKVGQALNFNGTSTYINAGHNASLGNLGPSTYSAWIYPRSFGGGGTGKIISKNDGNDKFAFGVDNIDVTAGLEVFILGTGANIDAFTSNNAINLNRWQFVTAVYNGSTNASGVSFYVNGVLVSHGGSETNLGTPRIDDSTIDLKIGDIGDGSRVFDGLIDDVRIYNRALSAGEVNKLYQMGR